MKILIIEDEVELLTSVQSYLEAGNYHCESATTFDEALDKVVSFEYDIVVLDINLPNGSGLDLIHQIYSQNKKTGILIISARNAVEDKIKGLDLGADDYISKPFHLAELNSRINALIRRKTFDQEKRVEFNEFSLDPNKYELFINERLVDVTQKEFEILLYFITNKNRVVTKQSIAEHLWGDYMDYADNFDFIYTHIRNLRKKIKDFDGTDYIKNVYGLGYKFSQ